MLPLHTLRQLKAINPKQMFFAYDTPDDYEPLYSAAQKLTKVGFTLFSRKLRCYVLIGSPRDTIDGARKRLRQVMMLGFIPMAMLYRDNDGKTRDGWKDLQRRWARPAIIMSRMKKGEL